MKLLTKTLIAFFLLTFCLINVNAKPVFETSVFDRGIDIIHPDTPNLKVGSDLNIRFWTYNATSGATITNATYNCTFYIIDNKGNNTLKLSSQPGAGGRILYGTGGIYCTNCWYGTIKAGNLTIGVYSYQIKCQGQNLGGYKTGFFEVTPTGTELTTSQSLLYGGFVFVFLFLFIMCIYAVFQPIDEKLKLFWCLIAYLMLVGITFILQQLAEFYLYQTFINSLAYTFWLVLMIGFFPLLIFIVALIVINIVKNKEIQSLMDRGVYQ